MEYIWCDISLNNLNNNLNLVKEFTNKKIIAVLKSNAYGLGCKGISQFFHDKVDCFAVSSKEEIKDIDGDKKILIVSPIIYRKDIVKEKSNISYTIDCEDTLEFFPKNTITNVHIYVDTGMNRLGIKPAYLSKLVRTINDKYKNIKLEGIYTHLHNTKNEKYTLRQIELFKSTVKPYIGKVPFIHCINSGGFLNESFIKAANFTTAIRIGNLLYGFDGSDKGYKRVYNCNIKVCKEYWVENGEYIGYGNTYKAKRRTKVGFVPVGLNCHLGFSANPKRNLFFDILKSTYYHLKPHSPISYNGIPVKIIGPFNMNNILVDLTPFSNAEILSLDIPPILLDKCIKRVYI